MIAEATGKTEKAVGEGMRRAGQKIKNLRDVYEYMKKHLEKPDLLVTIPIVLSKLCHVKEAINRIGKR